MLSPAGSARSRGKPTAHPATRPDSSSTAPWEGTILLTLLAPTSLCPRAPSPSPTARDWKSERTYCYNVLKSNVFNDDQSKINDSGFLFVFHLYIYIYIYTHLQNIHSRIYIISNSLMHTRRHAGTHTRAHALTNKTYTREHTCKHREGEKAMIQVWFSATCLLSKTKMRTIHWGYHESGWSLQARLCSCPKISLQSNSV